MKLEYEPLQLGQARSFRWMHLTAPTSCEVIWHYHPEYEIIYVQRGRGRRIIGNHAEPFEGSDLALIGTNVPHMNINHSLASDYNAYLLQLTGDFVQRTRQALPELTALGTFLNQVVVGAVFGPATQARVDPLLRSMGGISPLGQTGLVLQILQHLAQADDIRLVGDWQRLPRQDHYAEERIKQIYQFVKANYRTTIAVDEVASLTGLSVPSFCRYFKKLTRITFTQFVNEFRVNEAARLLQEGHSVTEACYESGFGSMSNFTATFKALTGTNPMQYRHQQRQETRDRSVSQI